MSCQVLVIACLVVVGQLYCCLAVLRNLSIQAQEFGASAIGGLPLLPPAGHVVVPRALYDHLRHDWNDRVLEAVVRWGNPHTAATVASFGTA